MDPNASKFSNKKFALIGCASDVGGLYRGAAAAPSTLRNMELLDVFTRLSLDFVDMGDIFAPHSTDQSHETHFSSVEFTAQESSIINVEAVYDVCAQLARRCEQATNLGHIPVVIGGDHSLSIGSVAGIVNARSARAESTGLLWVDAHSDICTPEESKSHCAFGMPVAAIAGRFQGALTALCNQSPMIEEQSIYMLGLRDVDPPEAAYIRKQGLHQHNFQTMTAIDHRGIGPVVSDILERLTKKTDGFILSFDLDVCDPRLAPGTGTPRRGGLTFRESHLVLEMAAATEKLVAVEFVELNPGLDRDNQTAELTISLLESALGKVII